MNEFGTVAYFDRLADELGDDFAWRALQRVRLDWCLSALARFGRPRYDRALDVGCGYGHFAGRLAERCGRVVGLDGAVAAVQAAAARYPRAEFRAGRLEDAEFGAGEFDLICALEVLYYLPPAVRTAVQRRLIEWIHPGGDLLIAVRMKDTPVFQAAEADALVPPGMKVVGRADLRLGWLHPLEALIGRAIRWARRRHLGPAARPAKALYGWSGWLRAGAAVAGRMPSAAPTYRLWLARKPA